MTHAQMQAPERTHLQRMSALGRANDVRTTRAALKRDIKAGRASVPDLLLDPPWYVETMKVIDLLLAVQSVGRTKAGKVLKLCHASMSKTVGGLSDRQRAELVSALRR